MENRPVVIIGAGHAGVGVAVRLVELKWPGGIVLIDEQDTAPYERPPLSKDLLKAGNDGAAPLLRKPEWFEAKGIHRIAGRAAVGIDRQARTVHLSDGTSQPYHRLVIATGAQARALPAPGADLPGVQMLKVHQDAVELREALRPGSRVVIVGAGYIGMEVAAAAATAGCETTVVEFQARTMARVTSEPVSRFFENLHEQAGTRFQFGAAVTQIQGDGHVERVLTSTGEIHPADRVIVGIGVVPNQQLAEQAGLECRDGIVVDDTGRTSDPHVYAVGDVTRSTCPLEGESRRLECIQNATYQANQAARHILGATPSAPEVPWFWTVQHGVRLQTAGVRRADDEVVLRGDPATGRFTVLYLRQGRLAAADTVGTLADFKQGKKLIASKAPLDPRIAADPAHPLAAATPDLASA